MPKSNDAAVLAELVRLAQRQAGDTSLIRAGMRIVDRASGRPRKDAPMHTDRAAVARARKMAGIPATALALVAGLWLAPPAHAARGHASDERTCERFRDEHPGFLGAFNVTAHKAAWNGTGFDDEPRQFTCPAAAGGEGVAAMRVEKVPARAKHQN